MEGAGRQRSGDRKVERTPVGAPVLAGINMFSEADDADFESAREAGVTVVRFGAVGDAQDFRYLDGRKGAKSLVSEQTSIACRRNSACGRSRDQCHRFARARAREDFAMESERYDFRLWCSPEYRDRYVALWSVLAQHLRHLRMWSVTTLSTNRSPQMTLPKGISTKCHDLCRDANALYKRPSTAIRKWDEQTRIIFESTYWASPRTLPFLQTYNDQGSSTRSICMLPPPIPSAP